jgi:hypothetical protein
MLLRLQCTCTAFLLVLHVGKCGLMLQSPQGLASEPGKEAAAAEPQEDNSASSFLVKETLSTCSLHLTFVVGAFVKKALSCASGFLAGGLLLQSSRGLASEPGKEASAAEPQEDDSSGCCLPCLSGASATSSLLVKEALVTCSLPILVKKTDVGALVKKALSCASGLLAGMSGVLVRPRQIVNGRLPIPVCAVRTSASLMKKGAPVGLLWWQQSGSLSVFADGSLKPFFVGRRSTNVGRGVVASVVVEQPLGGAWGRLRPFELQPPGRIGEGGRGQMSRRGSTVPHLGRIRECIVCRFDHFI